VRVAAVCGFLVLLSASLSCPARAQDNYEIQVYGYETVEPRHTMIELHSNFTFQGSKTVENGLLPTNHQWHETIEITHGFTDWFETGFYIFTSTQNGQGWDWVGDHIRPRVRVPKKWNWPVGLSLSNEIGYQRRQFSTDTWTWEMRPIIDKQIGRWYLSFNPTLDRSFHGESVHRGVEFSPNAKVSLDLTRRIAGGLFTGTLSIKESRFLRISNSATTSRKKSLVVSSTTAPSVPQRIFFPRVSSNTKFFRPST